MQRLLAALFLSLGLLAAGCVSGNGTGCSFDTDCATNQCCLTCARGPCSSGQGDQGVCCAGSCDPTADGGCPKGTRCTDGGLCE